MFVATGALYRSSQWRGLALAVRETGLPSLPLGTLVRPDPRWLSVQRIYRLKPTVGDFGGCAETIRRVANMSGTSEEAEDEENRAKQPHVTLLECLGIRRQAVLDRLQWYLRARRNDYSYEIARRDSATEFDDTHNTSLADELTIGCPVEDSFGKAATEVVQLPTGVP